MEAFMAKLNNNRDTDEHASSFVSKMATICSVRRSTNSTKMSSTQKPLSGTRYYNTTSSDSSSLVQIDGASPYFWLKPYTYCDDTSVHIPRKQSQMHSCKKLRRYFRSLMAHLRFVHFLLSSFYSDEFIEVNVEQQLNRLLQRFQKYCIWLKCRLFTKLELYMVLWTPRAKPEESKFPYAPTTRCITDLNC